MFPSFDEQNTLIGNIYREYPVIRNSKSAIYVDISVDPSLNALTVNCKIVITL